VTTVPRIAAIFAKSKAAICNSPLDFSCIQMTELEMIHFFEGNWHTLLLSVVLLIAAVAISPVAHSIVFWLLRQFARRKAAVLDQSLIRHGRSPSRWIFPLLTPLVVLPGLPLPPILRSALEHITGLGLIFAIAWPVTLFVDLMADVLAGRYRIDIADNLVARRVKTQFQMLVASYSYWSPSLPCPSC
jgi:hypothetical protein